MVHAYSHNRATFCTFYADHAVSAFLHVEQALATAGAFDMYHPILFFRNSQSRHFLLIPYIFNALNILASSGHLAVYRVTIQLTLSLYREDLPEGLPS